MFRIIIGMGCLIVIGGVGTGCGRMLKDPDSVPGTSEAAKPDPSLAPNTAPSTSAGDSNGFKAEVVSEGQGASDRGWIRYENTWRAARPLLIQGSRQAGQVIPAPMYLMLNKTVENHEIAFLFYSFSWLGPHEDLQPRRGDRLNPQWDAVSSRWSIPLSAMFPSSLSAVNSGSFLRIGIEAHLDDGSLREAVFELSFSPVPPALNAKLLSVGTAFRQAAAQSGAQGSGQSGAEAAPALRYELVNPTFEKMRVWIRAPESLAIQTRIRHTHYASQGRVENDQPVITESINQLGSLADLEVVRASVIREAQADRHEAQTAMLEAQTEHFDLSADRFVPFDLAAGERVILGFDARIRSGAGTLCSLPADQARGFVEYTIKSKCGGSMREADGFESGQEARTDRGPGMDVSRLRDCDDVRVPHRATRTETWRTAGSSLILKEPLEAFVSDSEVDEPLFAQLRPSYESSLRIAPVGFEQKSEKEELKDSAAPMPQAPCQGVY